MGILNARNNMESRNSVAFCFVWAFPKMGSEAAERWWIALITQEPFCDRAAARQGDRSAVDEDEKELDNKNANVSFLV